jgi:hypothetical protein
MLFGSQKQTLKPNASIPIQGIAMPKEIILAVAFIATAAAWIRCLIVQRELQIYSILRESKKTQEKAESEYKSVHCK